jgi:hypothetical protein
MVCCLLLGPPIVILSWDSPKIHRTNRYHDNALLFKQLRRSTHPKYVTFRFPSLLIIRQALLISPPTATSFEGLLPPNLVHSPLQRSPNLPFLEVLNVVVSGSDVLEERKSAS